MLGGAWLPVAEKIQNQIVRIYFATRNSAEQVVITYIEVEAGEPRNVLYVHDRPVLGPGEPGAFDDWGVMPSGIVHFRGLNCLYYVGCKREEGLPEGNGIGMAVGEIGREGFLQLFSGPVLGGGYREPRLDSAPWVLVEGGRWRMWYTSPRQCQTGKGGLESVYPIKYAESEDGIHWEKRQEACIEFESAGGAGIHRPCVVKEAGRHHLWFCCRGMQGKDGFRRDEDRIAYAESEDGIRWVRRDEGPKLEAAGGWDAETTACPFVYEYEGRKYMLYHREGPGRSGIGYAVLEGKPFGPGERHLRSFRTET